MKYFFYLILITGFPRIIFAENSVYTYTNAQGNLVVGNKPTLNAKPMPLPPLNVITPYVGANETGRRQILRNELTKEQIALSDTQQMLIQSKNMKFNSEIHNQAAYQNRIQSLQNAIKEHKKNIELLNKQLGN